jgi:uncharacterized protein
MGIMDSIFSGLEELGFKNLNEIDLYKQNSDTNNPDKSKGKKEASIEDLLYGKSYRCPICCNDFKSQTVKVGKARLISKDTDLMPRYENINPLFYDVVICQKCGYSALSKYFERIKEEQILLVKSKITPNFKSRTYPDIYDLDIAIERYKLSLLNAVIKNTRNSEKAYICLKIAWLYRLKQDKQSEIKFLEQSYIGFKEAYEKETFPVCGMDSFTLMYLIGELARRLGNDDESLQWLGRVITGRNVNPKLKDLARDQKNLIKDSSI